MTGTAEMPRVVDNDRDEITATLDGKEIRGWSYETEAERRVKMLAAREFCEGWHQAQAHPCPAILSALHASKGCLAEVVDCYSPDTIPDNQPYAAPYAAALKLVEAALAGVTADPVRAAAHDVLAALKKAEAHIDHVCGETTEDDLPEWFSDLRTIRAAIAKAEGR